MNAAEIMTKPVITITADANIGEIAALLVQHKISAVPVIDDDRHVIGIVSEGDLLGRPPSAAREHGGCGSSTKVQSASRRSRQPSEARDAMIEPVVTVVDQTPVDVLPTLMRRRKVKRVPALQNGEPVGIVSRTDLLDALMRRANAADERP